MNTIRIPVMFAICILFTSGFSTLTFAESVANTDSTISSATGDSGLSGQVPLFFIANQGQLDPQVKYYLHTVDKSFFFTSKGLTLTFKEHQRTAQDQLQRFFSGVQDKPRYWAARLEFIGANNRVALKYRGAEISITEDGELKVAKPFGGLVDQVPVAWQGENTDRHLVSCSYNLTGDNEHAHGYGFKMGTYDSTRPLILDPGFIVYSGLLGSSADDISRAIAMDSTGHAYITGYTSFSDFPRTVDLPHAGYRDVFVAKLDNLKVFPWAQFYPAFTGAGNKD